MTGDGLITALSENLREVLKDYKLQAEGQTDKKVSVYKYDIPHGRFENDTYIPYVIVTPKIIDLVERDSIMTVAMLINTYVGEYGDDWRDMMSIAERIRQYILTTPIMSKKYLFARSFHFEPIATDQPSPFIIGYIEADYRLATPEPAFKPMRVREF